VARSMSQGGKCVRRSRRLSQNKKTLPQRSLELLCFSSGIARCSAAYVASERRKVLIKSNYAYPEALFLQQSVRFHAPVLIGRADHGKVPLAHDPLPQRCFVLAQR
jgi:hypothetical protein